MSKELILKELQKRGVNPKLADSSNLEKNKIIDELKEKFIQKF